MSYVNVVINNSIGTERLYGRPIDQYSDYPPRGIWNSFENCVDSGISTCLHDNDYCRPQTLWKA